MGNQKIIADFALREKRLYSEFFWFVFSWFFWFVIHFSSQHSYVSFMNRNRPILFNPFMAEAVII